MKPIAVTADRQDYFGQEVFDLLVAETQWRSDYNLTPNIVYQPPSEHSLNVLFLSMPESVPDNIDLYDLVLLDNADEAFGRGTEAMYAMLYKNKNCYLLCNSFLHTEHFRYSQLNSKIITTMLHWNYHRRTYVEPMFAPSREYQNPMPPVGSMIYINGRNRSWREHISLTLKHQVPKLQHHDILHNQTISETKFVWYEDFYDSKAREFFNNNYCYQKINQEPPEERWPCLPMGINGRFGQLQFYDRFFPAFRQHHVIVYPETTWQNNILSLTEKSLKCFLHKRWAMPFGGSNMHVMFKDLGFHTAWILLPSELSEFDQCQDHVQRWHKQCEAINWLLDHPEVFETEFAQRVLQNNQAQCIVLSSPAGQQLYQIINEKT